MNILQSQKNHLKYLEHTKIVKIDEKVAYTKDLDSKEQFFAIPYANIAVLLLGPGTSITQSAIHHLVSEGILVGFTGGDGFPIFSGSLSEYRPTEYCQKWILSWQSIDWRLEIAKKFQFRRIELVNTSWNKIFNNEFMIEVINSGNTFKEGIKKAITKESLLGYEANYAKSLYRLLSKYFEVDFKRKPGEKFDLVNDLIDSHNYYAYGIAGTCLWTLGIPYAFPVLHGETRRGGLVFDLADIIKDAFLLPLAFISAKNNIEKNKHKKECIKTLNLEKTMNILFDEIKDSLENVKCYN